MAAPTKQYITVEDFDAFILQPENIDQDWEYIGGEIVSVVSNNYASQVASIINFHIRLYLHNKKLRGNVTGSDGGYVVMGERYIPDVGYISAAKQPEPSREAYNPLPPELAVEVISPTDNHKSLMIKVVNYMAAGAVVWVVDPDEREVHVYVTGQQVMILSESSTLTGGDLLPGFELPVNAVFPEENTPEA